MGRQTMHEQMCSRSGRVSACAPVSLAFFVEKRRQKKKERQAKERERMEQLRGLSPKSGTCRVQKRLIHSFFEDFSTSDD